MIKEEGVGTTEIFRLTLSMILKMPDRLILPEEGRDGLHQEAYLNKNRADTQMDSKNVHYMTPLGWLRRNSYTTGSSWAAIVTTLDAALRWKWPCRTFPEVYRTLLSCISLARRREEEKEILFQLAVMGKKKKPTPKLGGTFWSIKYPNPVPPPPEGPEGPPEEEEEEMEEG